MQNLITQATVRGFESELYGNITINSCLDFNGNMNLKLEPQWYQGTLHFKAILGNSLDSTLDLDLTTTHPDLERIRLQFNMVRNSVNGYYSGTLLTIIPMIEDTKVVFKVPAINLFENEANLSISNLNGQADIQCHWNLQDMENLDLQVLIKYPEGGKLSAEMKMKADESLQLTLTSTNFDTIELRVKWSPDMSQNRGFVFAEFDILDEKLNAGLTYQLQSVKEFKLSIDTSFEGYEVGLIF